MSRRRYSTARRALTGLLGVRFGHSRTPMPAAVHPFFKRYPNPCDSVPSAVSGHLVWTEDDGAADCGSESVVTVATDPDELRPVQLVTVDDFGSMAVALELRPKAAVELARRLVDAATAAEALHASSGEQQ